jgi:phospholipase/carboxylesterase
MQSDVLARFSAPGVAFILPRAPTGSWYAARATEPLVEGTRVELAAAIQHLAHVVESARREFPGRPLLLAGFSQGACLSIEYLCAGGSRPDVLMAFTGCRVGVSSDSRPKAELKSLPVYLSGGDEDPWIPVTAFAEAALAFGRAGAKLRADLFPGRPHHVSEPEIGMLYRTLIDLSSGRHPSMEAAR